jgi:hypothetical protein
MVKLFNEERSVGNGDVRSGWRPKTLPHLRIMHTTSLSTEGVYRGSTGDLQGVYRGSTGGPQRIHRASMRTLCKILHPMTAYPNLLGTNPHPLTVNPRALVLHYQVLAADLHPLAADSQGQAQVPMDILLSKRPIYPIGQKTIRKLSVSHTSGAPISNFHTRFPIHQT